MRATPSLCKSLLLTLVSTTLTALPFGKSLAFEVEQFPVPEEYSNYSLNLTEDFLPCGLNPFCRQPTRFTNGTPSPLSPPSPPSKNFHYYTKIILRNDTNRKLRIHTQFHIDKQWQRLPGVEQIAVVQPGQSYSPILITDVTKDKNVVTGKNFMIVVVADGKIWNPKSQLFQSLNNGAKYEYKEVIMDNKPEFTYRITEAKPSLKPWIFPIPNW
ncbi:hypothetical protein NIES2107_72420 (plasmid) [Nostoc carneum NIES-2107]|nr:hypothetical protein NIES2107_72420 [Nostoc carneum NIES-2107]